MQTSSKLGNFNPDSHDRFGQFAGVQFAHFNNLHYSPSRTMNLVLIGNLWPASRIASRAVSSLTPCISKRTVPFRTFAAKKSGEPLPPPILSPSGLRVTGV